MEEGGRRQDPSEEDSQGNAVFWREKALGWGEHGVGVQLGRGKPLLGQENQRLQRKCHDKLGTLNQQVHDSHPLPGDRCAYLPL